MCRLVPLETGAPEAAPDDEPPASDDLSAAATAVLMREEQAGRAAARGRSDALSPWHLVDAWRLGHPGKRIVVLKRDNERYEVDAHGAAGNYELAAGTARCVVRNGSLNGDTLSAGFDDVVRRFRVRVDDHSVLLHDGERRVRFERVGAFAYTPAAQKAGDRITAPMPGRIVLVKVKDGDKVEAGEEILVIEAMKMELSLKAPQATTIASLHAKAGDFVEADAVLVRFAESK